MTISGLCPGQRFAPGIGGAPSLEADDRLVHSEKNPSRPRFRAVLLDVDGTLYNQARLRLFMGLELFLLPFVSSWPSARRVWRIIRAFRSAQEELRGGDGAAKALSVLQCEAAARRAGCDVAEVATVVDAWIQRRPLKYLRWCRHRDVSDLLGALRTSGIKVGVLSDYPAGDKLQALGLAEFVSVTLCTTDKDINAFKPHPRGFLRACEIWGVAPEEVLYVGDRVEVDAAGAAAAGMACAILGRGRRRVLRSESGDRYYRFPRFNELRWIAARAT